MQDSIKTLNLKDKEFKANGQEYFFMDKISIRRFKQYEKLVPQLTFGLSFQQIFDNLNKAYGSLNKSNFADSAVILHNIMKGIKDLDDPKRVHPALLMATLMIGRKGEDLKNYDKETALDKINDWEEEGLDMMGFINVSLSTIQGFRGTLTKFTQENEVIKTEMKQ